MIEITIAFGIVLLIFSIILGSICNTFIKCVIAKQGKIRKSDKTLLKMLISIPIIIVISLTYLILSNDLTTSFLIELNYMIYLFFIGHYIRYTKSKINLCPMMNAAGNCSLCRRLR